MKTIQLQKIKDTDIYSISNYDFIDLPSAQQLKETLKAIQRPFYLMVDYERMPKIKGLNTILEIVKIKWLAIKKLKRYAVVSSKKWVKTFVEIVDWLTPSISIRKFDPSERYIAFMWLNPENNWVEL